jgi:hypothetical protein
MIPRVLDIVSVDYLALSIPLALIPLSKSFVLNEADEKSRSGTGVQ